MIIVVSYRAYEMLQNSIELKVVPLMPYDKLDLPVSSHADMLLCVIDKTVFCYEEYYKNNISLFNIIEQMGYDVIRVKHQCNKKYPHDIGLNALVIGKKIFCKADYAAKEIIEYGKNNGYKIIRVKQGYAACSCLVVNENTVITSDMGMKKALEKEGIKVYIISNDKIILDGYNCGFVGGSGFIWDNKAYFFGQFYNIIKENHKEILEFFQKNNIEIYSVSDECLEDFGGAKIFL